MPSILPFPQDIDINQEYQWFLWFKSYIWHWMWILRTFFIDFNTFAKALVPSCNLFGLNLRSSSLLQKISLKIHIQGVNPLHQKCTQSLTTHFELIPSRLSISGRKVSYLSQWLMIFWFFVEKIGWELALVVCVDWIFDSILSYLSWKRCKKAYWTWKFCLVFDLWLIW